MKLIESKAEYIPQPPELDGIYKQIELCGRVSYKSEDKITPDSAKGFVDRMIKSHHGSVLEHGTVYLQFQVKDPTVYSQIADFHKAEDTIRRLIDNYTYNSYSKTFVNQYYDYIAITTNLRVLVENNWLEDLQYICEPTGFHEKRYTMRFTCSRSISHELVRQRKFSFMQESTRYCNYSKNKFSNRIVCVSPSWINDDREFNNSEAYANAYERFYSACEEAEGAYFDLLDEGFTPQQAREVLPNALKTEVIMAGFSSDWKHFYDLRYFGKTGAPHPDMLELTTKAKAAMEEAGIWEDIMSKPSK